jgi:hypothetical protein
MPSSLDRFLKHSTGISRKGALGRVFGVSRESWRLTDDPKAVQPDTEAIASGRTASEAADLARQLAAGYPRRGFHKPSGSWWAADDIHFHRFVVHAGRRRPSLALLLVSGAAGLAAFTLLGRRRRPPAGP